MYHHNTHLEFIIVDDILKKITQQTSRDVQRRMEQVSMDMLQKMPWYERTVISLYQSIKNGSGIIAEHKRQSPSKGSFNCPASLKQVVTGYENAGASALSCLTDQPFFGGTLSDLQEARQLVNIPILRKDFMISSYQIHEAKAYGADAILLIAACLRTDELGQMGMEAINLGMEVLYEVHDREELDRVKQATASFDTKTFIIGVNNRDLKRFKTNVANSKELLPHFPAGVLAISESGISDPDVVVDLQKIGFDGFLIGENFMKTTSPGDSCASFIRQIQQS